MAVEVLNPMVIDGTAKSIEGPPGTPADPAPFVIPPERNFIAMVWAEDGRTASITVRGVDHRAAMIAMTRAGLKVYDDGMVMDAAAAPEPPPES